MNDSKTMVLHGETFELMISAQEINDKTVALAQQIKNDIGDEEIPLFICILKGSFVFASDLLRAYKGLCEIEFVRVSSYAGTSSTGKVNTLLGMDYEKLRGRRVVIIEDIIDTGLTMQTILKDLEAYAPKTLDVASLFIKPDKLCGTLSVKYNCFKIPDVFIVGYGLDYDELYRNLPAIYIKK